MSCNITVHVFQASCESVHVGTSFFIGFGTQDSTNYRGSMLLPLSVLLLVNKPACELSNKSLLTTVQSQDGPRGLTGRFYMYSVSTQVVADDRTARYEDLKRDLWCHIADD